MVDLCYQADQPQIEYNAEPIGRVHKNRPLIVQPDDPTIRYIRLTRGLFTTVDAYLYDWLCCYLWYASWNPSAKAFYAKTAFLVNGVKQWHYMNRFIVGLAKTDPRRVDHHLPNSTLVNTGANLRIATVSQNGYNRGCTSLNKSGYKGVSWCARTDSWLAQITHEKKAYNLGRYSTKEGAARAYDRAALLYHGKFAVLNFPKEGYRSLVGLTTT